MASPETVQRYLQTIPEMVLQLVGECIETYKTEIIALVIEQQADGMSGNEATLAPYSPSYAMFKQRKGVYSGHTDYFLTGGMQQQMDIRVDAAADIFEIFSDKQTGAGFLSDLLIDREIRLKKRDTRPFDLNDQHLTEIAQLIRPLLIEKLNNLQ